MNNSREYDASGPHEAKRDDGPCPHCGKRGEMVRSLDPTRTWRRCLACKEWFVRSVVKAATPSNPGPTMRDVLQESREAFATMAGAGTATHGP